MNQRRKPRAPRARPRAAAARPLRDDARTDADHARDERLLGELQEGGGRDALDRHRERLTPVEAEEDGLHEDDLDDERGAEGLREQALREQDEDDPAVG